MDPVLSSILHPATNDTAAAADSTALINPTSDTASTTLAPTAAAPLVSNSTATLPSIPSTLPRDCRDLVLLLQSMGLAYHPSILPLLLDHYHQLTSALLTHVATTAAYTHHTPASHSDMHALLASFASTSSCAPTLPPPVELMLPLAVQRNAVPLPLLRLQREKGEVMLPPDRFLLTHRSWQAEVGHETRQQRAEVEDGMNDDERGGRAATTANGNGSTVS